MDYGLEVALQRAREGDKSAFALIYDHYSRPIRSFAYRLLGNATLADDVTQDTFLRAWQHLGQLRESSRAEAWLYTIASHLCTDLLRRKKLLSWVPLELKHEALLTAGQDGAATFEESELVQNTLRSLPVKYSLPLVLRHVEGFSCSEVAAIMGISVDNVWQRLSRGREMFVVTYDRLSKGHPA